MPCHSAGVYSPAFHSSSSDSIPGCHMGFVVDKLSLGACFHSISVYPDNNHFKNCSTLGNHPNIDAIQLLYWPRRETKVQKLKLFICLIN
jgi:hypothetical protein